MRLRPKLASQPPPPIRRKQSKLRDAEHGEFGADMEWPISMAACPTSQREYEEPSDHDQRHAVGIVLVIRSLEARTPHGMKTSII